MRIEEVTRETQRGFVIVRGTGRDETYFSIFVDRTGASWSSKGYFNARLFATKEEAEECLREIRERQRLRRKGER